MQGRMAQMCQGTEDEEGGEGVIKTAKQSFKYSGTEKKLLVPVRIGHGSYRNTHR